MKSFAALPVYFLLLLLSTLLSLGCCSTKELQGEWQTGRLVSWEWKGRYDHTTGGTTNLILQSWELEDGTACGVFVRYPVQTDTLIGFTQKILVRK